MCGIVAVSRSAQTGRERAARPLEERVWQMLGAMPWRGPDGAGVTSRPGAAVGMCRLRVRSAPSDAVPFADGRGDAWAFNGEVYRAEQHGGPAPVAGGLPEARCAAASAHAPADGMWAVAHLTRDGVIDLRRDPWGIKPLWVRETPHEVLACSELPALLSVLPQPRPRRAAVAQLLLTGGVVDGGSLWDGVVPLPPGAGLRLADGRSTPLVPVHPHHGPAAGVGIAQALEASVRGVLDADRPVGLAVSGGLDSTVVALHAQDAGAPDLMTVSVTPAGEADGVRDLAALGLPPGAHTTWGHHHVEVGPKDLVEGLREVTALTGAPTGLTSAPLYLALARAAREAGIVVLLAGEGADELFGGYRSYLRLTAATTALSFYSDARRAKLLTELMGPEEGRAAVAALRARVGDGVGPGAVLETERTLSLGPLLERTDVTMMSCSIEARTPFLHGDVPALAARLPWSQKVWAGRTKVALRDAYAHRLPRFADEVKVPFRAPWARWYAQRLSGAVEQLLTDAAEELAGLGVRPAGVRTVLLAARSGDPSAVAVCFTLCSLAFWAESTSARARQRS